METEIAVYSIEGDKKDKVQLPSSVFSIKPNKKVLNDVVRMYLADKRQGSASSKERSEVRGGGRKPYRQKHTGRSRAGTIRSPLRRGGGVTFGPKPRDFSFKVPKKVRRLALKSAFSLKNSEESLKVIEGVEFDSPKTQRLYGILQSLQLEEKKVLFLVDRYSKSLFLSARNIPQFRISLARDANTYDVLWADVLLLTKESVDIIHKVFS
jgi:large subunit ribosomal protein L4